MTRPAARIYRRLGPVLSGRGASRQRFQALYDGWLDARRRTAPRDAPPLPENFVHAVWAGGRACANCDPAPCPGRTGDALRLALAALENESLVHDCVTAAIAAGLFDPDAAPGAVTALRKDMARALMQACGTAGSRAMRQAVSTREVMIDDEDFWTDLGALLPAVTFARRRLCRINVRPPGAAPRNGTGFLIGPSMVLTNLHVVEGVETSLPDPRSRSTRIELLFDYSETTGRKNDAASRYQVTQDWCVARGALGDASHNGPPEDYWWNDETRRLDWIDLVAKTLDYAVIRVDGAPGLTRGWYPLRVAPFDTPSGVWALHHPGRADQTITRGTVPLFQYGVTQRLMHGASTASGSSGGLILDQDGVPVALHYLGLKASVPDPLRDNERLNVAIPLTEIARELTEKQLLPQLERVDALVPPGGCIDGRRPLFGRKRFLSDLHGFWTGDRRILRVAVSDDAIRQRRPGKSYSAEIVRGLFRGPEHHHILFSAADLKVDALRIARDVLQTFAEDLVPGIPQMPDTTSPAHVHRLVRYFGQAIRDRLPNHNVWVIIDDLDRFDVSDASGREFLATLYAQVSGMPKLRIVLIGLPETVEISGMAQEAYALSRIDADAFDHLGDHLVDWLKARGGRDHNITDESFALIREMLLSFAGHEAPLDRLGRFVADHLHPAALAAFGPAAPPGDTP